MAFARVLFKILLTLLIIFVIVGALLPAASHVERSIEINSPPSKVFPQVNQMRNFHAWSPWSTIDPHTRYEFSGPEAGVGSRMAWRSEHDHVGNGSMQIKRSEHNLRVEMTLNFGGKGHALTSFALSPNGSSTIVTWSFDTEFGWDLFSRYVGLMMDSMIGANYEKGLTTLKQRVENI